MAGQNLPRRQKVMNYFRKKPKGQLLLLRRQAGEHILLRDADGPACLFDGDRQTFDLLWNRVLEALVKERYLEQREGEHGERYYARADVGLRNGTEPAQP